MNKQILNQIQKLSVIFIIVTLVFTSCNKQSLQSDVNSDKPIKSSGSTNPFDYVGIEHNEGLLFCAENITELPAPDKIREVVENTLKRIYGQDFNLKNVPPFPANINDLDLDEWVDHFQLSETLSNKIKETLILLQNDQTLSSLLSQIENLERNAPSYFSGPELDIYYQHLAVAKYSAIFWYPEEEGGMNGIQYFDFGERATRVNWWKVLGCDCVGGLVGGPGGYVGASAISVIMQL